MTATIPVSGTLKRPDLSALTVADFLREHADYLRRQGLREIVIFGSVAAGRTDGASDIDLAYDADWPVFDRADGRGLLGDGFLRELVEDHFLRQVDLVSMCDADAALKAHILDTGMRVPL